MKIDLKELKKDYIQLVEGQQSYEIPAGREVNELLWFTPSELNNLLFDPWTFGALGGVGLGGPAGYSQLGYSGSYFMMPAFDMLLRMQEINIQRRIIAGDLTYRVTALPEGKKAIHLMQTPGGKFDFGSIQHANLSCWYWYYETNDKNAGVVNSIVQSMIPQLNNCFATNLSKYVKYNINLDISFTIHGQHAANIKLQEASQSSPVNSEIQDCLKKVFVNQFWPEANSTFNYRLTAVSK